MNEPGAMPAVVPVSTPVDKRENVDEQAFRAAIRILAVPERQKSKGCLIQMGISSQKLIVIA